LDSYWQISCIIRVTESVFKLNNTPGFHAKTGNLCHSKQYVQHSNMHTHIHTDTLTSGFKPQLRYVCMVFHLGRGTFIGHLARLAYHVLKGICKSATHTRDAHTLSVQKYTHT